MAILFKKKGSKEVVKPATKSKKLDKVSTEKGKQKEAPMKKKKC